MDIQLTPAAYGRNRVDLPPVRLVNAYSEESPGGPTPGMRTARPGLTQVYNLGQGPILAVFQQPGLFFGDLFTISGNNLYRNDTLIGPVAYSANPQMVAADGQLVVVSGGSLYIYDGTNFTNQVFFDDGVSFLPQFSGVSVLYNLFVYPQVGTDEFFFSAVGNPSSINAANFSTVQTAPDQILQSYVLAEEIYFFGQTSVEIWDFTGNLTAPFALAQGRTYARGCAAQSSVRKLDNALFWVGDDYTVYRSATVPQRVSTSFIEDRLRACGANLISMTTFTSNIEGHVMYVMNLTSLGESYAYDCQTQMWACWGTQTRTQADPGLFIGSVSTGQGDSIFVGSYKDGRVFKFDTSSHTDDGTPMVVIVSAQAWINEGVERNTNIALQCVRGTADASTPLPKVSMRYSDDGGRTWTSWVVGQLAFIGSYRFKVAWRSLGIVKSPGREIEFRISEAINVTIENITANAARI